jgi:hypothetical protein
MFFVFPPSSFFKLIYFYISTSILNKKVFIIDDVHLPSTKTFQLEKYVRSHNDKYSHYLKFQKTLELLSKTLNLSNIEEIIIAKCAFMEHRKKMQINFDFIHYNRKILETYNGSFRIIDKEEFCLVKSKSKSGLRWKLMKVFQPHGRGYHIDEENNTFFEGLYHDGICFHGRLYHYDSKYIFYGLFENGKPYDGIISMPSGSRYEGTVSSSEKPNGHGFFVFENGNYLHGIFHEGYFTKGIYKDFKRDGTFYVKNEISIDFRDKFFQSKLEKNFSNKVFPS